MDIEGQGQQPTTNYGDSSAECLPFFWLRNMDIGGQQLDGGGSAEKIKDDKDNPTKKFLQNWNVIFLLSCVIAVSVDPLFFYLPVINQDKKCLRVQKLLWTTTIALRSVNDIIKLSHIILQFRIGFIDEKLQKSGRVGKDEWNKNAWDIARRRSYFVVDILAILPIPQVIMSSIFSVMSSTKSSNTLKLLNSVVLFQYVPRVVQIYQSWKELRSDKKFDKIIWFKAALNFFLYVLAGH
ncbi:cyclic nucleotide-gated ion channel 1-like isoform X5, partial [Fagus crenata]